MSGYPDAELDWCRGLMGSLRDGGVWGVPRSGLMFQKDGDTLTLTERMPLMPEMPITEGELREQQDAEFEAISSRFVAAGFEVRDESFR